MTHYIVKQFSYGQLLKKSVVVIPNGHHPKNADGSALSVFPSGSRIYYESNGKEVAMIYTAKDGSKRVRWHRV